MEWLPAKEVPADELTDAVPLVSLGCSCQVKFSFKELGRGAETLPFDWIRVSMDGLVHFLETDFDGFFDAPFRIEVPLLKPSCMTAFRSHMHSFWHDDPSNEDMREKYGRRILRFLSIDASDKPVLFVRAIATTDEVPSAGKLADILTCKFGPNASLLMIVDQQGIGAMGPCAVQGRDNLLLYFNNTTNGSSPYCEAVRLALDWAVGRKVRAGQVSDLSDAFALARETNWGLVGTSGVASFEPIN